MFLSPPWFRSPRRTPSGPLSNSPVATPLWAIKALRDEPLPLFASASVREGETVPEILEPIVALRPMTPGGEVVEDYGHVGLSLRHHPVCSSLREELRRHSARVTCDEAMRTRDGRVGRGRRPCSPATEAGHGQGVMFITIEGRRPASPISLSGRRSMRGSAVSSFPPACSGSVAGSSAKATSSILSPIGLTAYV